MHLNRTHKNESTYAGRGGHMREAFRSCDVELPKAFVAAGAMVHHMDARCKVDHSINSTEVHRRSGHLESRDRSGALWPDPAPQRPRRACYLHVESPGPEIFTDEPPHESASPSDKHARHNRSFRYASTVRVLASSSTARLFEQFTIHVKRGSDDLLTRE